MIQVGILGAKGYASGEALRWLLGHPEVEVACLMARVESATPVAQYFGALRGVGDLPIEPVDLKLLADQCEVVFLGVPHTAAAQYAKDLIAAGTLVVDLSADFRFDSLATYEQTYSVTHPAPELNPKIPYALPELFGADIADAPGLAIPGCYPTAALLGLAPLAGLGEKLDLDRIVINALSGVSGAGRKAVEEFSFTELNESMKAYSVGGHRHRPEVEEKFSSLVGRSIRLPLTTHLIPITRGMIATSTIPIKGAKGGDAGGFDDASARALFADYYDGRPFIRVLPEGEMPTTAAVRMTNFCDIGVKVDTHAGVLIVVTAIDNLGKGAAGQAVQAMNIRLGFPETLGLILGSTRSDHAAV